MSAAPYRGELRIEPECACKPPGLLRRLWYGINAYEPNNRWRCACGAWWTYTEYQTTRVVLVSGGHIERHGKHGVWESVGRDGIKRAA
jgi:hypothetical protein